MLKKVERDEHFDIGAVLKATLGKLLNDRAEHIWAFLSAIMPF